MSKTLIITEKVDAGCQVSEALYNLGEKSGDFTDKWENTKSKSRSKGFLESNNYVIVWSNGHMTYELKPSEIDESFGFKWQLDKSFDYAMPTLLKSMKWGIKPDKKAMAKNIKELIAKHNFQKVFICTDADAEGERIARDTLFKIGKLDKKADIRRFWVTGAFNSVPSIKENLASAKPYTDKKYECLYASQRVRSDGDYLFGMKLTKTAVDTYGAKIYSGRVKNTIIGLIGDRELEIKNFVPKPYYTIKGILGALNLTHFYMKEVEDVNAKGEIVTKKERDTQYFNRFDKDKVVREVEEAHHTGSVTRYDVRQMSSKERPLPLSGDDFKGEMAKLYKLTLEQSGEILQYLRDQGFTTYQGTNGRYFAIADQALVQTAFKTAMSVFSTDPTVKSSKPVFSTDVGLFDDKKASKQNHPPLHLTDKTPTQSDYAKWESSKIPRIKEGYELIAKRILVHFLENDLFDKVNLEIEIKGHKFDADGEKPIKQGWREFMGEKKANTFFETPKPVKVGDSIKIDSLKVETKETKKPNLYTEADLLKTLMNVSRVLNEMIDFEDDPDRKLELKRAKEVLKNVEGIGTDRTREPTIKDLIEESKTIEKAKKGGTFTLTENGWTLYFALPPKARSVLFTAKWEEEFEKIRRGERSYEDVISDIDNQTILLVQDIIKNVDKSRVKQARPKAVIEELQIKCPLCGQLMVKSDKVYKCSANKYGDTKSCQFTVFKDQSKILARVIDEDDLKAFIQGDTLTGTLGHTLALDVTNAKFNFTKVTWAKSEEGAPRSTSSENNDVLMESPKAYKLNGKTLWKDFRGKDFTRSQAEKILKGGAVKVTRKSSKGTDYSVGVRLGDDGKIIAELVK